MDDPKLQDGDEPNLSGPEDSVIGGALIRPLLVHVQALVFQVSLSICIVCNSDTVCLGSKVSQCEALPEGVLHQSLNKTTGTHGSCCLRDSCNYAWYILCSIAFFHFDTSTHSNPGNYSFYQTCGPQGICPKGNGSYTEV